MYEQVSDRSDGFDEEALSSACRAVESALVDMRDNRVSLLGAVGAASGLVVRESDGERSSVVRLTTRQALELGIRAYLEDLERRGGDVR